MKVLLAHAYFLSTDKKERTIMRPYPPLGLLSISAWLERESIEHEVFDSTFQTEEKFYSLLGEYKPDVIAVYCNLMTKAKVLEILEESRAILPKLIRVLGGPDLRYNLNDYLKNGGDYAVIGEGEESFTALLKELEKGPLQEALPGIAFLRDQEVIQGEERPFIRDISLLPEPAYHKINVQDYLVTWQKNHGMSMMSVSTQRGCPYTCKWCSTAVYGQSYRRRNPEAVVGEMMHLQKNYNPDAIWFVDDVFTVSHKWLKAFRDELKKQSLRIPFECITRADRMNEEVIQLLKESGCFRVWIGAESGSQRIIDAMDRRVEAGQVRSMIALSRKHGIEAGTFIMLGYPGEEITDIEETVDHLVKSDPDHFTITLAYPIKGTSLFEEVQDKLNPNFDWTTQSDRERNFQRTYDQGFYTHAIRKVVNEVNFRKNGNRNMPIWKKIIYFFKWQIAEMQMKAYLR